MRATISRMAFGQQSGPPASHRQVQHLLTLIEQAGHSGLRDARGALGLNQRQAGGKFTADEAAALIEQLEAEALAGPDARATDDTPAPETPAEPAEPAQPPVRKGRTLRSLPDAKLATELERRGWIVIPPAAVDPEA